MIIAGLEKLSLLDFPGRLAATVFTYGCTMRCPFCHNPELVTCPLNKLNKISTSEVIDFMITRVGKLQGLAITGGEPSMHRDLIEFMQQVKQLGFQIKLDTYGLNPARVREIMDAEIVDYWAMDIKGDLNIYQKCGYKLSDLTAVDESIEIIKKRASEYEFRTTVLKGTDWHTVDVLKQVAEKVSGSSNYYIQNFRLGKHIGDGFSKEHSFTSSELIEIRDMFVDSAAKVGIRD